MLITNETQLLDEGVRKKLLEEMRGPENKRRKAEMFKRYECLKDKTDAYVLQVLACQFSSVTVREMQYAITNISFARTIIDKLARVYSNGVKRTLPKDQADSQVDIDLMAKVIKINSSMKKWNTYVKAFRNTLAYIRPCQGKFKKLSLEVSILAPHLYDVVSKTADPREMMAVILSDYRPSRGTLYAQGDAAFGGRSGVTDVSLSRVKDGVNQAIADPDDIAHGDVIQIDSKGKGAERQPGDKAGGGADDLERERYVWWTENYHFTTNGKGTILAVGGDGEGADIKDSNPIKELPFVNLTEDQDEQFWAEGGNDIADSAIKINAFLTHIVHIAVTQGYGQLVMSGKDLPESISVGPNHAIKMNQNSTDEPTPVAQFISASPPIAELQGLVEMYVALALSTNNLSTKGVSAKLDGGAGFPSGIAMLLDKAESMEDIQEQSELFIEAEPEIWCKLAVWHSLLKARDALEDGLQQLTLPEDPVVIPEFNKVAPIVSEKEQLEIYEKRLQLGLSSEIEILMRDNPGLTEEAAKEKLKKILEEKIAKSAAAIAAGAPDPAAAGKTDNADEGNEEKPLKPGEKKPEPKEVK